MLWQALISTYLCLFVCPADRSLFLEPLRKLFMLTEENDDNYLLSLC